MPWLDQPVVTERLVLRPFGEADVGAARRMLTDARVRAYLGGPLDADRAEAATGGPFGEAWGSFAIEDGVTAEVVGSCDLSDDRGELEVSYQLLPEWWGRGYATEAVGAVVRWAFAQTPAPSIIAVTQVANDRSRRLLERLGAVMESTYVEFDAPQAQYRFAHP